MKTRSSKEKESAVKRGGDLITYFCTPDEQVLYFVDGPVSAATFTEVAQWSLDTMNALSTATDQDDRIQVMRTRYAAISKDDLRSSFIPNYTGALDPPLRPLAEIEQSIFEQFTNNRFQRRSSRHDALLDSFKTFQNEKKLILLVITPEFGPVELPPRANMPVIADNEEERELCREYARAAAAEAIAKYTERVGVLELSDGELTILLDDLNLQLPKISSNSDSPTAGFLIFGADGKPPHKLRLEATAAGLAECVRRRLNLPTSKTDPEELAKGKVQAARRLLAQNPAAAKEWLQRAIEMYPNTQAAREAQTLIADLEQRLP